jgi:hypothetical protein
MKKSFYVFSILLISIAITPNSVSGQSFNYYFGNLHAHTAYSDGNKDSVASRSKTPADCYKYAKQAQHFDFLGISEHNHSQAKMHLANYAKGLQQAKDANTDNRFVALYGMEFGVIKNGGHVLVYGLDKLVGWEPNNYDTFCDKFDYATLWKIIRSTPNAFATLAHPDDSDYSQLANNRYQRSTEKAIAGVALITGPAFSTTTNYSDKPRSELNAYYKKLLALGYMVGPTIDHDNHNTTFGRTTPGRTVILAQALDKDSIIYAYRARRFYASQDWNTKVNFTINGAPMGNFLKRTDKAIISASITDEDNIDKTKTIKIFYGVPGSRQIASELQTISNKESLELTEQIEKGKTYYYYLEITQKDGDKIYTAPIWVQN